MEAAIQASVQAVPDASDGVAGLEPGRPLRGRFAVVRKDREWHDQAARKQLLKFFDALGPQHPATVSGRRKLATILFS